MSRRLAVVERGENGLKFGMACQENQSLENGQVRAGKFYNAREAARRVEIENMGSRDSR